MKKIIALLLALVMILALIGCGPETPTTGSDAPSKVPPTTGSASATPDDNPVVVKEWVVPVLSARTGPVAYVGEPAIWAAEYAAKMLNDSGGIRGVPVKVVPYDTEFTAEVGAQIASRLADDTLFMLGCIAAPVSLAISQIAYDAKMPNVGSYSYPEIRNEFAPYLCAYMSDSEAGDLSACIQWCEANNYKKIVLFYTPSDTSQAATKKLFDEKLAAAGIELVGIIEVETGTLDCGPAAVQALGFGADAYFCCLRADEAGKVINELRGRGVENGAQICGSFAAYGKTLLDICGENAEGIYIWQKLNPNYQGETWQKLIEAYKPDFNGETPSVPPITGYYNTMIALKQCYEELEITGDPAKLQAEREAIANWFFNSPVMEGCQGSFQWVNGAMASDAIMFRVEDGNYVPLD